MDEALKRMKLSNEVLRENGALPEDARTPGRAARREESICQGRRVRRVSLAEARARGLARRGALWC